ncbi:alpha/beta hydrolase [Hymenobacter qilianensis]|uniref:Alpha/beta hydrolase n=2 Tax=Hymenobacter qilianensis TaxID=1385715 RepID=A0ACB5PQ43_9BACT|nr:alpha/beta fold hydrolase [Hymenobacter qilianensis]QNP52967.1 alpha/beta fold hydrolase [Hymenobacter qilianensis]GGF61087.1 alpha/beta hydrolase [Hymenobacter qilianensis]
MVAAQKQTLPAVQDTLVDVGGHRLHFNVWPGKAPAILFEAGGGDDLSTWKKIVEPVYRATGATVITYDRAGFGKSELNADRMSLHAQVADLKSGLAKLGVDDRYVLVGHSFGGYFSTLFAAQYPKQVKHVVLLDAAHVAFYTDARVSSFQTEYAALKAKFKQEDQGKYWMLENAMEDKLEMAKSPFPASVPVVDVLAETPYGNSEAERAEWAQVHEQFVAAAPNRRLIKAAGSGHYIMSDRPELVVETIAQAYREGQGGRKE